MILERIDFRAAGTEVIAHALDRIGAIIVVGASRNREELITIAEKYGAILPHPDNSDDGVTLIQSDAEASMNSGGAAFGLGALALHTDRSSDLAPPELMLLGCHTNNGVGGDSILADGFEVLRQLSTQYPGAIDALVRVSCIFGSPPNTHYGPIFTTAEDGSMLLRFRSDELGFFPTELWPIVGSFRGIAQAISVQFRLQPGDFYIVNNRRILHGRTAYAGERRMLRILLRSNRLEHNTLW